LADRTWLEASYRLHGRDSQWCRSHIFAQIPAEASDALIPELWLDWASSQGRPSLLPNDPRPGLPWLAIDLGEGVGRDLTVLLVRDQLGLLDVVASNRLSLAEAAERTRELAFRWRVSPGRISYDRLGIGCDFGNHLLRVGILNAIGYSGSVLPRNRIAFPNLRSEAAWNLRNRLDPNWVPDPRNPHARPLPFTIPQGAWWPRMREELSALAYETSEGHTRLIDKETLCARLGRSPDLADALIQSFAYG
jgi:hypothetical protein